MSSIETHWEKDRLAVLHPGHHRVVGVGKKYAEHSLHHEPLLAVSQRNRGSWGKLCKKNGSKNEELGYQQTCPPSWGERSGRAKIHWWQSDRKPVSPAQQFCFSADGSHPGSGAGEKIYSNRDQCCIISGLYHVEGVWRGRPKHLWRTIHVGEAPVDA